MYLTIEGEKLSRGWPSSFGLSYESLSDVEPHDKFVCVFNTDKLEGDGIHWVACGMEDGVGYFYNSLGDAPNDVMKRELIRIGNLKKLYCFDTQQQPDKSFKCGYYCLHFIKRYCVDGMRGISLYAGLGLTDKEMGINDKKIGELAYRLKE